MNLLVLLERRLDNVVLLLIPSLNPDGQIMITDYYRKYLGTKYEGGDLPWIYHHYTGHDNNRDSFMNTQLESRMINRLMYKEWFGSTPFFTSRMNSPAVSRIGANTPGSCWLK